MRTIKFRGKNKKNEWVNGDLIVVEDGMHNVFRAKIITHCFVKSFIGGDFDHYSISTLVEPETIGQFTGLIDKNGNEIYEGDIVKYTRYDWKTEGYQKQNLINYCRIYYNETKCAYYYEIKFKSGGGCSGLLLFNDERCKKNEIEVIGNIYDNPELLNEQL